MTERKRQGERGMKKETNTEIAYCKREGCWRCSGVRGERVGVRGKRDPFVQNNKQFLPSEKYLAGCQASAEAVGTCFWSSN